MHDAQTIQQRVQEAAARKQPLRIRGSGSKDFYSGSLAGEVLATSEYRGVVDYDPGELVLAVRSGTPLREVEALLAQSGQMLAFEPPQFGGEGTIGGCVACGLSGPRRATSGSVRDFVLGVRIIDGRGQDLRFGGRVIKNVAGYDVSRLMVGALGTLGVLLDVSMKVLPRPVCERTLRFEMNEARAIEQMNRWAGQPLAISATCFHEGVLTVRLSGVEAGVRTACEQLGGEPVADGESFWRSVRDQTLEFFSAPTLWRVSVPSTSPPLETGVPQLIEWGGALRWLAGDVNAEELRARVAALGGHATLFRADRKTVPVFHPLPRSLERIHRDLKKAFDPSGILNPGRFHEL